MQEKLVYEYAVIRFVPRVERGEFMNVGVILLCKRKGYLGIKYHIDENRLATFYRETDLEELVHYLRTWELIAQGSPEGGPIARLDPAGRFRWLTAARSTILQSSEVHPGLCEQPEGVLEDLYRKYVL